jgi:hypothetical protein
VPCKVDYAGDFANLIADVRQRNQAQKADKGVAASSSSSKLPVAAADDNDEAEPENGHESDNQGESSSRGAVVLAEETTQGMDELAAYGLDSSPSPQKMDDGAPSSALGVDNSSVVLAVDDDSTSSAFGVDDSPLPSPPLSAVPAVRRSSARSPSPFDPSGPPPSQRHRHIST